MGEAGRLQSSRLPKFGHLFGGHSYRTIVGERDSKAGRRDPLKGMVFTAGPFLFKPRSLSPEAIDGTSDQASFLSILLDYMAFLDPSRSSFLNLLYGIA